MLLVQRNSFSISYTAGQWATTFLSFFLLANVIMCSFLNDSFTGYKILDWQFFTLGTLNMPFGCPLTAMASDEVSPWYYWDFLVQDKSFFSSSFHDFLFIFGPQYFTIMCNSWFILLGVCWVSYYADYSFTSSLGCFRHYFFESFFCSFSPLLCSSH